MVLSIVIPTREEEKVIGLTLEYLRTSLTLPHEIIVSDGHSSDQTAEIARRYADTVLIFSGRHHTAGIGRNDGARSARGTFLAFMDTDVRIPDPDAFFRCALAQFDQNPDLVGLTGPQRALPEVETWADRASFACLNVMTRLQNNLLKRGEASGKFMLVRRDSFEQIGGFREDIDTREDGDFFLRLSRIGRTRFDPTLIVYHGARRAHRIGWLRLWYIWTRNSIMMIFFDRVVDTDWVPIR